MPPNEPYTRVDWLRLVFLLPAIIFSNLCFLVYLSAGMGSAPGQDPIQLLILLLPTPFCILYIGVLCESRFELQIASFLALFFWLSYIVLWLFSLSNPSSPRSRNEALFLGAAILLTAVCALCAHLGQRIRHFLLNRSSKSQRLSILPSNDS